MKKRSPEEARNRINRLSEALFGEPEEIDEKEAGQALNEAGFDTDALNDRLYKRLYAEAQQYWKAQKDLPPLLKSALDQLRPLSAPPRNESELGRQAKAGVERIVEKARLLASSLVPDTPLTFAESFRNKKQPLTDADRKSLDAVQERLKAPVSDAECYAFQNNYGDHEVIAHLEAAMARGEFPDVWEKLVRRLIEEIAFLRRTIEKMTNANRMPE
jgi:hypothetical protein